MEKQKESKKQLPIATFIDQTVTKGGDWKTIIKKLNDYSKRIDSPLVHTRGSINAHIKYRLNKNPKYLGKLKVTVDSIK